MENPTAAPSSPSSSTPFVFVTPKPISPSPAAESSDAGARRTTRSRRTTTPSTGIVAEARPVRRKVSAQPPGSGPFSSMSAVALRTLTNSNTVKNQTYHTALLQTKVIRKDGERPESPVMKIKTVTQRQMDEKGEQRKQRAERRAKRASTSGDLSDSGLDEIWGSDDIDSSPLRGLKRGPGDDEEYMTPRCPPKRPRLDGEATETETEAEADNKKRVRWDHGLSTAVFLHEVQMRPYVRPKEVFIKKGCLAPTAKVRDAFLPAIFDSDHSTRLVRWIRWGICQTLNRH
ncbi:hypothetical protein C8J56DRAFT_228694 [Mycena floridula]|nr:hypothetical protein C8J56DRAFT_228694 [Mycena floridula]